MPRSVSSLARTAMLLALALALHQVEGLLPVSLLPYPGVKLGLANLVTIIGMFLLATKNILLLVILRCLLVAALGNISGLLFSLCGALLAFLTMSTLASLAARHFSLPALSVAGALAHNLGQLFIAALLSRTWTVLFYLPVLIIAGSISGLAIGFAALFLLRAMHSSSRYTLKESFLILLK